jgi:PTH1 family peptidyl-tRNA hydrolase
MKLIVGLGNPGQEYYLTRHNAGFMALDKMIERFGLVWEENKKFKVMLARSGDRLFMKPQIFMNLSGEAVSRYMDYHGFLPAHLFFKKKDVDFSKDLLVIHDDLDILLGNFKLSINSGSAGHRGVESLIKQLKTKNFSRLRIGLQSAAKGMIPTEKFVLGRFDRNELDILENIWTGVLDQIEKF